MDLLLPQCTVVYAPKDSKRKHHELRFTLPTGDALVLAVQSKEQAHRWLRVRLLLGGGNTDQRVFDSVWKTRPNLPTGCQRGERSACLRR